MILKNELLGYCSGLEIERVKTTSTSPIQKLNVAFLVLVDPFQNPKALFQYSSTT